MKRVFSERGEVRHIEKQRGERGEIERQRRESQQRGENIE